MESFSIQISLKGRKREGNRDKRRDHTRDGIGHAIDPNGAELWRSCLTLVGSCEASIDEAIFRFGALGGADVKEPGELIIKIATDKSQVS